MIVNPFTQKALLTPYAGTRVLQQDFGLLGAVIVDPENSRRSWRVQAIYAPIPGRTLGGIRAKLADEKDYITFITQMDFEVLLGVGHAGEKCRWSGQTYAGPGDRDFFGFCADDDDLLDDLYDRELCLRAGSENGMLYPGIESTRLIHLEHKVDISELHVLLWDADPLTGMSPDDRMETIEGRWSRIERTRANWEFQ